MALIHAQQFGGEQCGLVAAGASANFEDGIACIGLVARHQQQLYVVFQLGQPPTQLFRLLAGHLAHLRVGIDIMCQRTDLVILGLQGAQRRDAIHNRT